MKEVRVLLEGRGWMAAWYVDGKPDKEIVGLFGTHMIPTPYLAAMNGNEVVNKLQERNPETSVHLV